MTHFMLRVFYPNLRESESHSPDKFDHKQTNMMLTDQNEVAPKVATTGWAIPQG